MYPISFTSKINLIIINSFYLGFLSCISRSFVLFNINLKLTLIVIKMRLTHKEVETSYGSYEIYQYCVPVNTEKEDVFSCKNDCLNCIKQCSFGLKYKEEVMK